MASVSRATDAPRAATRDAPSVRTRPLRLQCRARARDTRWPGPASPGEFDAAVANYDRTLIAALRDVADIAQSRAATERQLGDRRAALKAATDAAQLAGLRYRAGLSTQLPQLTAEDSMTQLARQVADLEARRLSLDIALIRALGGGYQTNAGE